MGSADLAVDSYAKAFDLNPGAVVIANQYAGMLLRQGKNSQADEVLQRSINSGNRSVDAVKLLTQSKLAQGQWEEAENLARELQKIEGQEAISQQVLGVVFQGKEQTGESIEAFRRAHDLAPDAPQPMVALARTYIRDNRTDEARKFLESVLESLLGQISLLEKDTDSAIARFNRIIEVNPSLDIGYRTLASIYRSLGQLGKAEESIKRGLEANPDRVSLQMSLASLYEMRRQFDQAIEIYEAMLEKNPNILVAKNNLASLLTDYRGDQASLERALEMSVELRESPIPQFRDTYAWAAVRSGINLEEAVVILKDIVEENEGIGVYKYHLGEAYRETGDTSNAIAMLEQAVDELPSGSDLSEMAKQAPQQLN